MSKREFVSVLDSHNFEIKFLYLKSNPEKCFERALKRGRESEKELTLDFFKDIHENYENFFSSHQCTTVNIDCTNFLYQWNTLEIKKILNLVS